MPTLEQRYEMTSVERLRTHPDNPRRGSVETIAESIDAHGFYGSVVAQTSSGYVLAGNHRLLAARARGLSELPTIWLDVDDDQARKILLIDNRSSDLAEYDDQGLIDLLSSFDDLSGTGFTDSDLAALLSTPDDSQSLDLDHGALSIVVECESEQQQASLLERFESEGLTCRPLMM